jgi:type II secretory pathway component PulC
MRHLPHDELWVFFKALPMARIKPSRKKSAELDPGAIERIAAAALEHPKLGARRLAGVLSGEGIKITENALRSALRKQGLQTRQLRLKLLEERYLNEGLALSEPQQRALHDFNPCLRERLPECHQPGLLLIQDTVDLGPLKHIGRTFLHVAIDPSCCLAFAALAGSADPAAAVAVLNDQALAFFGKEGIAVQRVMAGRGVVAGAGANPGFEKFLKSQSIALKLPPTGGRPLNGFIERFERLVRKDFLDEALRSQAFQDLEALQSSFEDWLERFNRETPLPGYPIMGRTPIEAFQAAAPSKAARVKTEDRPTPEPEPVLVSLPTAIEAAPAPPATRSEKQYEWKPGREIWGFRAVNAALVCLVIYFGWVAASNLLDAPRLEENLDSAASVQPASATSSDAAQEKASPLAEYHVVWDRNLFAVSRAANQVDRREKIAVDKIALAGKDVGLKLIGTAVANDPQLNYAIIDVAATRDQGIFREKEHVGKAVIKAILRNNVIIETEDGRRKRLTIDEENPKNPWTAQEASDSTAAASETPEAPLGIHENPTIFQVPLKEIAPSLNNIRSALGEMSASPQMSTGNRNGFYVGSLGPENILVRLGLRPGDLIRGVDDEEFESPQEREIFLRRLAEGGDLSILIQRRGRLQRLNVLIE